MPVDTFVISDLHLGSDHAEVDALHAFLDAVPDGARLVINGDLVDYWQDDLAPAPAALRDRIAARAATDPVTWVLGNHDLGVAPGDLGAVEIVGHHEVGRTLYVHHGHGFDNVMPHHRLFIRAFKRMHALRVRLGAEPVHVAAYAKRWDFLYRHLRRNVLRNAMTFARENGFPAVTCGHTHYPEEVHLEGIRYINTGAWTERPQYYVAVRDDTVVFRAFEPGCDLTDGLPD